MWSLDPKVGDRSVAPLDMEVCRRGFLYSPRPEFWSALMIPFRLTQAQFRDRYARSLDKRAKPAIALLREHLALPVKPEVTAAEVKIFVGDEDPYEPSIWMYYVGKDNKVDNADSSLFAGRSLELPFGFAALEQFNERFFTDEKFGGLVIVAEVLRSWFTEMWWKAGGWSYATPTALVVADGYGGDKIVALTESFGT